MAALLLLYLVFAGYYSTVLLGTGSPAGIAMGIALLVLSLLGAGALVAELRLGVRAEQLSRRLEREGLLPDPLPVLASGRPDRAAAAAAFPLYRAEAEAAPESWRARFRLALVYDASGDRRRARQAMREALRLAKADPTSR
jgi:hypothetical protein